jgi:amidohydrolase
MDAAAEIIAGLPAMRAELAEFYKDLHRNPELSMQEQRTAAKAADRLRAAGYEVATGVGRTGVVGVLDNGAGPTVMLRADMDALPVREQTGLDYASTATGVNPDGEPVPVMHACGHDMHVTCLCATAALLARNRERWAGRLVMIFQPAEEIGGGAQAMIDDGLFERFGRPGVVLGQHVTPAPAGTIGWRAGTAMAAADSFEIKLFGRGSHGSRPQAGIDPVVMAASVVLRLQTIVAREVDPAEQVVVTVGSLHAGTKENVIPDQASIKLNVRTFSPGVRERVLDSIRRIAIAEATASNAPRPPEFRPLNQFPLLVNDPEATGRTVGALERHFGEKRLAEQPVVNASEDFGVFGTAAKVPSVFWTFGGLDPEQRRAAEREGRVAEIPVNHSPLFAPLIEPTLTTGVEALIAAALAWLRAR